MDLFASKYFTLDVEKYPVWGIDTSFYSNQIDWKKFRDAGGTFAIIKMLDGTGYDSWFERNYKSAKDAGVYVSTYQWLYSHRLKNVEAQAKAYAAALKAFPVDFYPSVDYEWYGSANPTSDDMEQYMNVFTSESDYIPMIYSAPGYLNDSAYKLGTSFSKYPLWLAHYGVSQPDIPKPFISWMFWQVTDKADGRMLGSSVYGESEIDANYFNGTKEEFLEMCNTSSGTEIISVPPVDNVTLTGRKYIVNTQLLNLRPEPSMAKEAIGKLYLGEIVSEISKNIDATWIQVKTESSKVGWCYAQYLKIVEDIPSEPQDNGQVQELPNGSTRVLSSEELFGGKATYYKWEKSTSHGNLICHIVKIPKEHADVFITPRPSGVSYVHSFLQKYKLQIAINGDGFSSVKKGSRWNLIMAGQSASKGQPYGTVNAEGAVYISKNGDASFSRPSGKELWNAIAFPNKLVEDGQKAKITRTDVDPRTALGFTQNSDIIILTVDGKETYNLNRTGASFDELAEIDRKSTRLNSSH